MSGDGEAEGWRRLVPEKWRIPVPEMARFAIIKSLARDYQGAKPSPPASSREQDR